MQKGKQFRMMRTYVKDDPSLIQHCRGTPCVTPRYAIDVHKPLVVSVLGMNPMACRTGCLLTASSPRRRPWHAVRFGEAPPQRLIMHEPTIFARTNLLMLSRGAGEAVHSQPNDIRPERPVCSGGPSTWFKSRDHHATLALGPSAHISRTDSLEQVPRRTLWPARIEKMSE